MNVLKSVISVNCIESANVNLCIW